MANENQQVAQEADDVIRAFIVEQVGVDMGNGMTDQAKDLRERLSDAVLLRDKEAEENFRQYALKLQGRLDEALRIAEEMRSQLVDGPELHDVLAILDVLNRKD